VKRGAHGPGAMQRLTLNPEQLAAATHGAGPALVLAGPGTGKTTTLVGRYAHLVGIGVDPARVFVSTFTRKAAQELRVRIQRATGIDRRSLPVGTFHSYCLRLTGASVIAEAERYAIIRRCIRGQQEDAKSILDAIDRFKDSLISPEDALAVARKAASLADREQQDRVAEAYALYQEELGNRGLADFGDLVWRSIDLLRRRSPADAAFAHLLIDEYQDINPAQDELIKSLLRQGGQLWVVGDDDQAIYGWRGSDVRYMTSFNRTYPDVTTYPLSRNYRSSPLIVAVAQALVRKNRLRLSKSLAAAGGVTQRRICVALHDDEREEAAWVASAVRKLIGVGVPPSEIAILLRTNSQTLEFEGALSRAEIRFVIRGSASFWDLPVAKALVAALSRTGGIGAQARRGGGPEYLAPLLDAVAQRAADAPFPVLVERLAQEAIARRPASMSPEARIQWDGAATQLRDVGHQFRDLPSFLVHCQRASAGRVGDDDGDGDAVALSTIHQAKGLEWEAVFVGGFDSEILPHKLATDYEEERRLAYVAVTRAKSYLTLTWASRRGGEARKPSPFLAELMEGAEDAQLDLRGVVRRGQPAASPKGLTADTSAAGAGAQSRQSRPIKPPRDVRRGTELRHAKNGPGKVLDAEYAFGVLKLDIDFESVGRRKMRSPPAEFEWL